jgi:pSer/pThr/pTyr-binding forkhead associated (FHA) protein
MVTAESRAGASPPGAAPVQTPAQPAQQAPVQPVPAQQMPAQQTAAQSGDTQKPGQATGGNTVKFTGNGITFEAKDGDVIGRKTGSFVGIFASYQYVSGTHCKIVKLPAGWHIQDLGSSNGTFVQGIQLPPNVPYPLTNNAAVKIATTDFTVTF